jgi:hypothetical protein
MSDLAAAIAAAEAASVSKEVVVNEPTEKESETETEVESVDSESEPEVEKSEEKAETTKEEDPKVQSAFQRLAAKEAKLQESVEAFKKESKTKEAEVQKLKADADEQRRVFEEAAKMASVDPVALFKALGVKDMKAVLDALVADVMGDTAPKELKSSNQLSRMQAEIDKLKAELQNKNNDKASNVDEGIEAYVGTLYDYAEKFDDSMPFLKSEMEENPQGVIEQMWDMADELYKKNPTYTPDPEEVAAALETRKKESYDKMVARYEKVTGKKFAEPKENEESEKVKTLSKKTVSTKTSAKKPDSKLTEEELLERAIKAAQDASR